MSSPVAQSGLAARLALALAASASCTARDGRIGQMAPEISAGGFSLRALRGRPVVLAFGYTYCPDVCPTTLSRLREMRRRLDSDADVAVVFVSVDPSRDTPERLTQYVAAFDPTFHAVSLEGPALEKTLDAYGVEVHKRVPDPRRYPAGSSAAAHYGLDHTSGYWLIDAEGRLRAHLPHESTAAALADAVRALVETPSIRIASAVARLSPNGLAAVYLDVLNAAERPDRLVGAETNAAARVELHEVVMDRGMARMVPRPEGFVVGASGRLSLAPGGKHLMLFDVRTESALPLSLRFERAGTLRIEVPLELAFQP